MVFVPETKKTQYSINQPTMEIAQWHGRWEKNRAFVEGEDAVKRMGRTFLPPARSEVDVDTELANQEYRAHLNRTSFFPAVNKIADGLIGLIFRKSAQLNGATEKVRGLCSMISPSGQSLDDLMEEVVRETMITNYTGLFISHPSSDDFENLTVANAEQQGYRPFMTVYPAESILEVSYGLVNNQRALTTVRLLENDGTRVRKLILNEFGIYEIHIYDNVDGRGFGAEPNSITLGIQNGEVMKEIPFVVVSNNEKPHPRPSMLQHSVDLNLTHYRIEGLLTTAMFFTAGPLIVVTGFERELDDEGEVIVPNWDVSAGSVWEFKGSEQGHQDTKVEYLVFKAEGVEVITDKLKDIKDALSTLGHSILAPEKAAPEAAETQLLRRAAENASLAAFTRTISRKAEKALLIFAKWVDGSTLTYSLNTDFLPQQMEPGMIQALAALVDKRILSKRTFQLLMRDGEVFGPAFEPEEEEKQIELETADLPPLDAVDVKDEDAEV